MKIGMTFEQKICVEEHMLASSMGSGEVDVLATPFMIAKMEQTSSLCVAQEIGEGNVTVGILVNVTHISPTPLGMNVKFVSELTEVDGKILTFKVQAFDDQGKIGEGTHTRAIVNKEKFQTRAKAKGTV
ncbi:MAG: thioesterase family protein [Clostridia bacterium]